MITPEAFLIKTESGWKWRTPEAKKELADLCAGACIRSEEKEALQIAAYQADLAEQVDATCN